MGLAPEFLGSVALVGKRSAAFLTLPRPMPGNPAGFATFATFAAWRAFVLRVGQGLQGLPLSLPRLGLGPSGELDRAVRLLAAGLCDAAGACHPQPVSLSLDPSPA